MTTRCHTKSDPNSREDGFVTGRLKAFREIRIRIRKIDVRVLHSLKRGALKDVIIDRGMVLRSVPRLAMAAQFEGKFTYRHSLRECWDGGATIGKVSGCKII